MCVWVSIHVIYVRTIIPHISVLCMYMYVRTYVHAVGSEAE